MVNSYLEDQQEEDRLDNLQEELLEVEHPGNQLEEHLDNQQEKLQDNHLVEHLEEVQLDNFQVAEDNLKEDIPKQEDSLPVVDNLLVDKQVVHIHQLEVLTLVDRPVVLLDSSLVVPEKDTHHHV